MLASFPVSVAVGILFGFLAGLGVGGGSLLILWLTLIVEVDPFTARCINLMFFIPCALIASIFRRKQGTLPLKKLTAPILCGAVLAGIFSFLSVCIDTAILKRIFGILLLVTGVRELLYRPKKTGEN